MKTSVLFIFMLISLTADTFSQSSIDYQPGTGLEIQAGADVCADDVNINGAYAGGGTICGAVIYLLNLTAVIQGFYDPSTDFMVSDTVTVYLRRITPPYILVDSIKRVLSSSGTAACNFTNAANGTPYYIVVKHRNTIETWSYFGLSFSSYNLAFNFTTDQFKAFGSNMIQIDSSPVRFAFYSGDINQDGVIDGADAGIADNAALYGESGYIVSDVNGDNIADGTDVTITDNNVLLGIFVLKP